MDEVDPQDLRISDADRHRVADVLRQAAAEGRLDLDELDERLGAAYAARTYQDLVPITRDLPTDAGGPLVPRAAGSSLHRSPPGAPTTHRFSVAVMSQVSRRGVWDVGHSHTATAFWGSVLLDLRQARFGSGEVVVWANAVMGGVEVLVDETTRVSVEGVGVMGSFRERGRPGPADAQGPLVRVRGVALMGSVEVRRPAAPEDD